MSNDVPSPAREPQQLPWQKLLVDARVTQLQRENAELHHAVAQLNARLRRANEARERWQLRQQAWHRERAELLDRLADDERRRDDVRRRRSDV